MKNKSKIATGIMVVAALSVPAKILGIAIGSSAAGGKPEYSAYQLCIDAIVALIFFLIGFLTRRFSKKQKCLYCNQKFDQVSEVGLCSDCQKLYEDGEIEMIVGKQK